MFASEYDMRQAGSWNESRQTVTTTIGPYCGVGCNLELHVQDNQIVKVTSPLRLFLSSPRSLQARSKSCRTGFPTMALIAGRNRPELGEYCHDRGHA